MDQNNENPEGKPSASNGAGNEGIDLSGMLKDSDTGMKFKEYRAPRSYYPETPKIIQWVIKYSGGLIKDEKQASYVLIGFVAVVIIIVLFLIFGGGNKQKVFTPGAEAPAEQVVPPAEF